MSDVVVIRANGFRFQGWNSARVSRSLETMAGTFSLSVADRWDGRRDPWRVREGDACEIEVNGETLITGYVDAREMSVDSSTRSISLSGRDRAGDLVDCSAVLNSWEFTDVSVLALAQKLCAPFSVNVALQPGVSLGANLKKHSIDPGDSVQSALENLCRTSGLLPVSDGRGGLLLARSGTERASTALELGKNLKSIRASFDYSNRYGEYRVLGSHKGRQDLSGSAAASVRGSARDAAVRASRILVVRPEGNVTPAVATTRAQWEAAVRAARSETVTAVVQGWTQSNGALWDRNLLVQVKANEVGVNGEMLISAVSFSLDLDGGTVTELTLKGPQAFTPDPTLGQQAAGNAYWKEIARGV